MILGIIPLPVNYPDGMRSQLNWAVVHRQGRGDDMLLAAVIDLTQHEILDNIGKRHKCDSFGVADGWLVATVAF